MVDDEFGGLAQNEESWANRILFWRRGDANSQSATTTQTANGPLVIDPASEAARLEALTGRRGIVIQPRQSRGIKLPGL